MIWTVAALLAITALASATQDGPQTTPPVPEGHFLHHFIVNPRHPGACPTGCKGYQGDYGTPGHRGPQGTRGPAGDPGVPGYYVTYSHGQLDGMPPEGSVLNGQILYNPSVKGPQGDIGDVGAAGNPGQDGVPGQRGPNGRQGRQGRMGEFGDQGLPGSIGDAGPTGQQGPKGVRGPGGFRGITGRRGDKGTTGEDGRDGEKGRKGFMGDNGLIGAPGATGSKGAQGSDGRKGEEGPKGLSGTAGDRGPKGIRGIIGADGPTGAVGSEGIQGTMGAKGNMGAQGSQGAKGGRGPYIEKVGVNETIGCDTDGRSKVKYDPFVKKLYYCDGDHYQCVLSDPCNRNCQVGEWGPWEACSATCGDGLSVRQRRITAPAGQAGRPCPALQEVRSCSMGACQCSPIPTLQNGGQQTSSPANIVNRGDRITWVCNSGFRLSGAHVSVCLASGQFDTVPTCAPVLCSDPGIPANADRVQSSAPFGVGDVLVHRCQAGYLPSQDQAMVCQADGEWSGSLTPCRPLQCADPGMPQNGGANTTSGVMDTVVQYSCNFGFTMSGRAARTCQSSGSWTGAMPTCDLVDCGTPQTPQFGTFRGSSTTFGSGVSYMCNGGYVLSGSRNRHCQADGSWSGELARCTLRECPALAANDNTEFTSSNPRMWVGVIATFSCSTSGFRLVGSSELVCEASGTWSAPAPTCEAVKCCPPNAPHNGQVSGGPEFFAQRDSAIYSCDAGYRLSGSSQSLCTVNGWSHPEPTCNPIMCGDPGVPDNGRRLPLFGVFVPTNQASFTCDTGYRLNGRSSLMCQTDGTWNGLVPTCEVITCTPPRVPVNGARLGVAFTYGSPLQFVCVSGFSLRGSQQRTCQLNGEYDGEEAFCDPDCVVGEFGDFSQCSVTCGTGTWTRSRPMLQEPSGSGQLCPELQEVNVCNLGECIQCMAGAYAQNDSAFVTPQADNYAADIVVVVERSELLRGAFGELRRFLTAIENDLTTNKNIGNDRSLPNMYTLVGFGGDAGTPMECGHQMLSSSASPGVTSFTYPALSQALANPRLSNAVGSKDGYHAMLEAVRSPGIRHMPNIAHNLILLTNASRGDRCGLTGDAREQVRQAMLSTGFTPNFIISHWITENRDKASDIVGVRTTLDGRNVGYTIGGLPGEEFTEIDLDEAGLSLEFGTHPADQAYYQLALDTKGALWNMNNFIGRPRGFPPYTVIKAAFETVKANEISTAARACKLCTCVDGGNGVGNFQCQLQANPVHCACRANGGSEVACARP